ncbi:glycosyltransferase [Lampropedia cohaerens]|uniref:glycosyltransferase n=1 Tax=Lampropedia cohaerens TaxID=1610491 RepID=UPI0018D22A65|nr:glycosyltransferase [Lampropedia cohaerens]
MQNVTQSNTATSTHALQNTEKEINIVFASDKNFLPYTAVTIASLLKNYKSTHQLEIYILTDKKLESEDEKKFIDLKKIHAFNLHTIEVDASQFKNIKTTPGISIATYYRLLMHDILPKRIEKVIYLDGDLAITDSISKLWEIDIEDAIFAGVEDSISKIYSKKFGLPEDAPHINAGVMLINLKKIREINFLERINEYIAANKYKISLGDQQIINVVFNSHIKYINLKWNVHGSYFDKHWAKNNVGINNKQSLRDYRDAVKNPSIIHYTYKRKPWISREHPLSSTWESYAKMTQYWADIEKSLSTQKIETKPNEAKHKIQHTYSEAKTKNRGAKKFYTKLLGYIKSVKNLRRTRLNMERLEDSFHRLAVDLVKNINNTKTLSKSMESIKHASERKIVPYDYLQSASHIAIMHLQNEARKTPKQSIKEFLSNIPENSYIFTNAEPRDIDGGFHDNIKTIFRSQNIGRNIDPSQAQLIIMLVNRIRNENWWKCINYASHYGKRIIFAETSFFGAFANYFDNKFNGPAAQSFGYILDDLSYYYDARQPSRLEDHLNSSESILTPQQKKRAENAIDAIIKNKITKYNAYVKQEINLEIDDDCIIIIDQKPNDASIEFASATPKTFELMISAAISENPNSTIYFKKHPDNISVREIASTNKRLKILDENVDIVSLLEKCRKVYTVSSQVGFEAILRGIQVETFGIPFYAGWGLTNDRQAINRRQRRITKEELFYASCIEFSVYINPFTGKAIELEDIIPLINEMRSKFAGA